jgi:hypothetical protein
MLDRPVHARRAVRCRVLRDRAGSDPKTRLSSRRPSPEGRGLSGGSRVREFARGGLSPQASRSQAGERTGRPRVWASVIMRWSYVISTPSLTRDACGRGEMNRVERAQCRPTDLRGGRHYRLDRKQSQPGEYADGAGGSVTAEAARGPGDLDRGEQA